MLRTLFTVAFAAAVSLGTVGCNQGTPEEETYDVAAPDPMVEAKAILTNYSKGSPVTSEVTAFPSLIERVKEKDPAKGAILEKGLNEIKDNPATAKAKATELLQQL